MTQLNVFVASLIPAPSVKTLTQKIAIAILKKASNLQNFIFPKAQLLCLWFEFSTHPLVYCMHWSLTLSPYPTLYFSSCLLSYLLKMFKVHSTIAINWYSWTKHNKKRCHWTTDWASCTVSRWAVTSPPGVQAWLPSPWIQIQQLSH